MRLNHMTKKIIFFIIESGHVRKYILTDIRIYTLQVSNKSLLSDSRNVGCCVRHDTQIIQ